MQYIDKTGNRHDIPLTSVQPKISPDADNALYESANGLKVDKGSGAGIVVRSLAEKTDNTILIVDDTSGNQIPHASKMLYGTVRISSDLDNQIVDTVNGIKVSPRITRVVTVPATETNGMLSAEALETLNDDKKNMIERDGIVYTYTSSMNDGRSRYTAVNKHTNGMEYVYTILLNPLLGNWEYSHRQLITKNVADVPKTLLTWNSTGAVNGTSYYFVKNNVVTLMLDGFKGTTGAGVIFYATNFPAELLPNHGGQLCIPTASWDNNGTTPGFFLVNPNASTPSNAVGVRIKLNNTTMWGYISYML